jgi:inward rectifier potassium channel
MLRLAYGRSGTLMAGSARLHMLVPTRTPEGRVFRSAVELPLVRSHTPLLVLTWTIMHVIDEKSPLYGVTAEQAIADDMRSIVTFEARDHSLSSAIHDVQSYSPEQLRFGMAYEDIVTTAEDKSIVADVRRISDVKPE